MQKTPKQFRSYSVKRISNLPASFHGLYAQVANAINAAAQYPDLKQHMPKLIEINEKLFDMNEDVAAIIASIKPEADRTRATYNIDNESVNDDDAAALFAMTENHAA